MGESKRKRAAGADETGENDVHFQAGMHAVTSNLAEVTKLASASFEAMNAHMENDHGGVVFDAFMQHLFTSQVVIFIATDLDGEMGLIVAKGAEYLLGQYQAGFGHSVPFEACLIPGQKLALRIARDYGDLGSRRVCPVPLGNLMRRRAPAA
ncbi:MAG: hypothetical protein K2Z25_16410 [Beijerinckiaceae bacterium]|nr:hypothetical protein [Beijerinckiaceae bacterium]